VPTATPELVTAARQGASKRKMEATAADGAENRQKRV